jgi:hypothetical protein
MSTGSISTYDHDRIAGFPGAAVRVGQALEHWGRRVAEPVSRVDLERRVAIEREVRASVVDRSSAHVGVHGLLR